MRRLGLEADRALGTVALDQFVLAGLGPVRDAKNRAVDEAEMRVV